MRARQVDYVGVLPECGDRRADVGGVVVPAVGDAAALTQPPCVLRPLRLCRLHRQVSQSRPHTRCASQTLATLGS